MTEQSGLWTCPKCPPATLTNVGARARGDDPVVTTHQAPAVPSLRVWEAVTGHARVLCSRCDPQTVLDALELTPDQLAPVAQLPTGDRAHAVFSYRSGGRLWYQHLYGPDDVQAWRHPVKDGWHWGMGSSPPVLWWPEHATMDAVRAGNAIWLCPNEPSAWALAMPLTLAGLGFASTMAAGYANWRVGLANDLVGASDVTVIVEPEKLRAAKHVGRSIWDVGIVVNLVMPRGQSVAEHLRDHGVHQFMAVNE
jgi:hypothetical protein